MQRKLNWLVFAALVLALGLLIPVQAADEKMRHVVVLVLIGIAHVGAMHNQAMIQQRAVAIGRDFQLVGQIASRIQVILIQFCVIPDLRRIVLMM